MFGPSIRMRVISKWIQIILSDSVDWLVWGFSVNRTANSNGKLNWQTDSTGEFHWQVCSRTPAAFRTTKRPCIPDQMSLSSAHVKVSLSYARFCNTNSSVHGLQYICIHLYMNSVALLDFCNAFVVPSAMPDHANKLAWWLAGAIVWTFWSLPV